MTLGLKKIYFLRSQRFKNIIKIMVCIGIHFFGGFKILMVWGISADLSLEVWEVLRIHFQNSWRYLRLPEISMNFKQKMCAVCFRFAVSLLFIVYSGWLIVFWQNPPLTPWTRDLLWFLLKNMYPRWTRKIVLVIEI